MKTMSPMNRSKLGAAVLMFSLAAACGNSNDDPTNSSTNDATNNTPNSATKQHPEQRVEQHSEQHDEPDEQCRDGGYHRTDGDHDGSC